MRVMRVMRARVRVMRAMRARVRVMRVMKNETWKIKRMNKMKKLACIWDISYRTTYSWVHPPFGMFSNPVSLGQKCILDPIPLPRSSLSHYREPKRCISSILWESIIRRGRKCFLWHLPLKSFKWGNWDSDTKHFFNVLVAFPEHFQHSLRQG